MDKEQLRDHFAGLALQSLLLNTDMKNPEYFGIEMSEMCRWSYIIADEMLVARVAKKYVYDTRLGQDKIIKNNVISE
jgi:hypothetical protein